MIRSQVTSTYEQVLAHVLARGARVKNRTGTDTLSVFGPEIQIDHDLSTGFPLLTTKTVPFEKVAAELAFFLSGSTRVQDLHPVRIWDAWSDPETGELGPIYSHLWRRFGGSHPVSHGEPSLTSHRSNQDQDHDLDGLKTRTGHFNDPGVDQIANLVRDISTCALDEGASVGRRLIMLAWDPRALPFQALPPCHLLTQFCVRDRRLSCVMTMRSADLFLGVPWNLASYALLTHLLAHTVNETLPRPTPSP